jgi:uncharacterized protein YaaN involved in tellurite resistance
MYFLDVFFVLVFSHTRAMADEVECIENPSAVNKELIAALEMYAEAVTKVEEELTRMFKIATTKKTAEARALTDSMITFAGLLRQTHNNYLAHKQHAIEEAFAKLA